MGVRIRKVGCSADLWIIRLLYLNSEKSPSSLLALQWSQLPQLLPFPVVFVHLGFDDLAHPLSWPWLQGSSSWGQHPVLCSSSACPLFWGCWDWDSSASQSLLWGPWSLRRQVPVSKGYLLCLPATVPGRHVAVLKMTINPVPFVFLSFLWDVKDNDEKVASEQQFIKTATADFF